MPKNWKKFKSITRKAIWFQERGCSNISISEIEDLLDLFRLSTFVQHDTDPPCDAPAYLFGHTAGMEDPILECGARLFREHRTRELFLCKLAPGYAEYHYERNGVPPAGRYPDFETWRDKLVGLGVYGWAVSPIMSPVAREENGPIPASHTGSESELLVYLAGQMQWRQMYLVAHPIHALRAFTNVVTFVERFDVPLKVYIKTSSLPQPWCDGGIFLNQGVVEGSRLDTGIAAEFDRINRWHDKGDLLSCSEVLDYVRRRN